MQKKIALVTGGMRFRDFGYLEKVLDMLKRKNAFTHVLHGGAKGVDTLASRWCKAHQMPVTVHYPDWRKDGKGAGFINNGVMLEKFDVICVLAFPGGKGTQHMVSLAKKQGIPVVKFQGSPGPKKQQLLNL